MAFAARPILRSFNSNDSTHSDTPLLDRSTIERSNLRNELEISSSSITSPSLLMKVQELPPMDRGIKAWRFVAAATILEMLVWGPTFSFGAWQEFYTSDQSPFDASAAAISSIGTISLFANYAMISVGILIIKRFPTKISEIFWFSLALYSLSFLLASFAEEIWQLVLTQGVFGGIFGGLAYAPLYVILGEWFKEKKGLAGGIIFSGSALGGFIFPPLITKLNQSLSFRWTLRVFALLVIVLGSIVLLNIERRIVISEEKDPLLQDLTEEKLEFKVRNLKPTSDWSFFKRPLFWVVIAIIWCQGFYYSSLAFYLPSFAVRFSSESNAGWTLSAMNAMSMLSQTGLGYLCDLVGYRKVTLGSGLLSVIGVLAIFRSTSTSDSPVTLIFVFAFYNGLCSGGFASIWFDSATDISRGSVKQSGLVFGMIGIARGTAAIVGPALVGSLIKPATSSMFGFDQFSIIITAVMCVGTIISLGLVLAKWQFKEKVINYETANLEV